jgi:hypothetical protein
MIPTAKALTPVPGLDPGIHALLSREIKDVDGRVKPGQRVSLGSAWYKSPAMTGFCGGNGGPRLFAGEAEWVGCRRILAQSRRSTHPTRSQHNFRQRSTQADLDEIEDWTDRAASRMYEGAGLGPDDIDILRVLTEDT